MRIIPFGGDKWGPLIEKTHPQFEMPPDLIESPTGVYRTPTMLAMAAAADAAAAKSKTLAGGLTM